MKLMLQEARGWWNGADRKDVTVIMPDASHRLHCVRSEDKERLWMHSAIDSLDPTFVLMPLLAKNWLLVVADMREKKPKAVYVFNPARDGNLVGSEVEDTVHRLIRCLNVLRRNQPRMPCVAPHWSLRVNTVVADRGDDDAVAVLLLMRELINDDTVGDECLRLVQARCIDSDALHVAGEETNVILRYWLDMAKTKRAEVSDDDDEKANNAETSVY